MKQLQLHQNMTNVHGTYILCYVVKISWGSLLVSHETQTLVSWVTVLCFFDLSIHPESDYLPMQTLRFLKLCPLASSIAAVIITMATRGRCLKRNINFGRNSCLHKWPMWLCNGRVQSHCWRWEMKSRGSPKLLEFILWRLQMSV